MTSKSEESLLEKISALPDSWFHDTVDVGKLRTFPTNNPRRRQRASQTPVYDVFWRRLELKVVRDVAKLFGLKRCGLLVPLKDKNMLWHLAADVGFPEDIRKRKIYRAGLGLSGRALKGEVVVTNDLLNDARRSQAHGDQWVDDCGNIVTPPPSMALLCVPIWTQPMDLVRRTFGAIIAIREEPFQKAEVAGMNLVAQLVSQGFHGLEVYQRRLEVGQQHADLIQIWTSAASERKRLQESLELIKRIIPFERLLLSLVSSDGNFIEGRAVVGFRDALATQTKRAIFKEKPEPPQTEDILALFVRERRIHPEVVCRSNPHVHPITALRHQVHNDLLLLPLIDSKCNYVGLILAELPDGHYRESGSALSPAELKTCSLFAKELADLLTASNGHKVLRAMRNFYATAFALIAGSGSDEEETTDPLCDVLAHVCRFAKISRSAIYLYDEREGVMRCEVSTGVELEEARAFIRTATPSEKEGELLSRALASTDALSTTLSEAFPFDRICRATSTSEGAGERALAIPLRFRGEPLGVLAVSLAEDYGRQARWKEVLDPFLPLFTRAIRLRRSERELENRDKVVEALKSFVYLISVVVADRVHKFSDLHEIVREYQQCFDTLVADVGQVMRADLVELFLPTAPILLDDEGQIPPIHLSRKFENIARFSTVPLATESRSIAGDAKETGRGGLTSSVLQTMRRQRSSNVPEDPVWSRATREFQEHEVRSWLGVPIKYDFDGETYCWGVLTATRRRHSANDRCEFTEDDLVTAQTLADWFATVLSRRYELRSVATRIESFLRRFEHDLPNLVADIQQSAEECLSNNGEPTERRGEELRSALSGLRACLTGMMSAHGPSSVSSARDHLQVDYDEIRKQLTQLSALQSTHRGGDLTFKNGLSDGECVLAEQDLLVYALFILIQNSFRACREKYFLLEGNNYRPHVSVEFQPHSNNGRLEVSVKDNGTGFPAAMENPNLIEEGVSHWSPGTKKGMGLGRTLVRRLVTTMDGEDLTFRNIPGTDAPIGAEVRFLLHKGYETKLGST